jgi:hypothetical protein
MKRIYIAIFALFMMNVFSACVKNYDEVILPYNAVGNSEYTYTTRTDYFDKYGALSSTKNNTGNLYFSSTYNYVDIYPLYGWKYTLRISNFDIVNGTFNIPAQDVYVNDKSFRITQKAPCKINSDNSIDLNFESTYYNYEKTTNALKATKIIF